MLNSIRGRLILFSLAITGCGLGATSLAILILVHREAIGAFDDVLRADTRTVAAFIEYEEREQVFVFNGQELIRAGGERLRVGVRTPTGTDILIPAAPIPPPPVTAARDDTTSPTWAWVGEDGRHWRAIRCRQRISEEGRGPADPTVLVTLARPTTELDRRLLRFAGLLLALTLGACVMLGLVLAWGTRRGLRPLVELTERLARLDGRDLGGPLPAPPRSAELRPVIATLNHLLGRIGEAFTRERAMGSALAHELRTPLAGLRAVIDVAAGRERDAPSYRRALDECGRMTAHLQGMVEALLLMTRLERGQVPLRLRPVVIGDLLRGLWKSLAEDAGRPLPPIRWELAADGTVVTDEDLLTVVLRNLLANALDHGDPDGGIAIVASSVIDGFHLQVRNACTRLGPEAESLVFERFWRGDQARGGDDRHCGLGLGLARDIALALGGTLTVGITGTEFSARLTLPRRPQAAVDGAHAPLIIGR